jgi:hypothetical protein
MGDIYVTTWVTDRRRAVAIDHDGHIALWDDSGEGEAAAELRAAAPCLLTTSWNAPVAATTRVRFAR